MKYLNSNIRDQLAANYVLGTMSPRARQRFAAQLRFSPELRRLVGEWERRLTPIASSIPEITPPAHVWRNIEQTIHGRKPAALETRWWNRIGFWRAMTGFACAALLALVVVVSPESDLANDEDGMMVVVMDDMQTKTPAMTVSWEPGVQSQKFMRLRVIGHAEMAADTAWELWLLPQDNRSPISLGLITTHELQTLQIPAALMEILDGAWGLGMTVEPAGGSPTGTPSEEMLYMGRCVKT